MSKRSNLNLPKTMTKTSMEIIGKIYGKIGSIRHCADIYDFGKYRCLLVKEYDKAIKKLERKIKCLNQKKKKS